MQNHTILSINKVFSTFGLAAVILLFFLSLHTTVYAAGTPTILSYQGRLSNAGGDLVGGSGTSYYFKFSIWNVATGGTSGINRLWPSIDPISFASTVRQGVFNVNIGDTDGGFPQALDYNFNTNKNIFLQIEVSSNGTDFETLSPRLRISSAPFAQLSGAVSGTGQSSFGTTTPFGTSVVSIESTSTQSTGLSIHGVFGQLADLLKVQDSVGSSLFILDKVGNVGVGIAAPSRKVDVLDANSVPQLRLSQSGSVYGEFYVDSAGDVRISATGGNIRMNEDNLYVCSGGACGATSPADADKGNVIVETSIIFDNNFRFKQTGASTTIMYDTTNGPILEFDEGQ